MVEPQRNLRIDRLELQVSDDENLNAEYELALLQHIDRMHDGMDTPAERQAAADVEVQVIMGGTASLTAGIVSWVLRGASLLASLMSTVPLLNRFDPLPIIKQREEREDVDEDDGTDDVERQHAKRVDKLFSGNRADGEGGPNE